MKLLILISVFGVSLADALYGYGGHHGYAGYYGLRSHGGHHSIPSAHLPATVLGGLNLHPNGAVVPQDEPAVVEARIDHLHAKDVAYSHGHAGYGYEDYGHGIYKRSALYGYGHGGYGHHGYAGYYGLRSHGGHDSIPSAHLPATVLGGLNLHPNGAVVPQDEPAVIEARIDHLHAKDVAYSHGYAGYGHGIYKRSALYGYGHGGYGHHGYAGYYGIGSYGGHASIPSAHLPATVLGGLTQHPNGAVVPQDEPAVVAARLDHLHAKDVAYSHGHAGYGHGIYKRSALYGYGHGGYGHHGYAGYYGIGSYGGHASIPSAHLPATVLGGLTQHPNGAVVPQDEPAVVAARIDHLHAKDVAYSHGHAGYGYEGHGGYYK